MISTIFIFITYLSFLTNLIFKFPSLQTLAEKYSSQINKAYDYLNSNMDKEKSLLHKAHATYVMQKFNKPQAKELSGELKSLAKTEDDRQWWSSKDEYTGPFWRWSFSEEIKTTSYMLSTLLQQGESIDSVLPIVRWLMAQRNSYGGFASTQDTVIGLQALIDFVQKAHYEPAVMSIEYTAQDEKKTKDSLKISEDNGLLFQVAELPAKSKGIDFTATGKGAALIQVSYQYNVEDKEKTPSFKIETIIAKGAPKSKIIMDICSEYIGEGESSSMAILEIELPSGFEAEESSFEDVNKIEKVRVS